jgi:hypothetical protein
MVHSVLVAAVLSLITGSGNINPVAISACRPDAPHEQDSDADGLSDTCEFALATAFAPVLLVRAGGCNWDVESTPQRLGGGYLHAVERVESKIRIAYLPAYFLDCGWRDLRCLLPFVSCAPHAGDSEFIVVEVEDEQGASTWTVTGVFLSAHCFGSGASSCRWYRDADLQRFQWHEGGPIVWVAEGRHANYPSWQACNAGHRTMDTCARHDARYRFPVRSEANLGSRSLPRLSSGCIAGHELDRRGVDPERSECFWRPDAFFRGWQASGAGVTPYERYLREIAEF